MLIHVKEVDAAGAIQVEESFPIDAGMLIAVARDREQLVRTKGQAFAEAAVPVFGALLVKAARAGNVDEMHQYAINAAINAWLTQSIFEGLDAPTFINSNLHFTMRADGSVKFDRIRAMSNSG